MNSLQAMHEVICSFKFLICRLFRISGPGACDPVITDVISVCNRIFPMKFSMLKTEHDFIGCT